MFLCVICDFLGLMRLFQPACVVFFCFWCSSKSWSGLFLRELVWNNREWDLGDIRVFGGEMWAKITMPTNDCFLTHWTGQDLFQVFPDLISFWFGQIQNYSYIIIMPFLYHKSTFRVTSAYFRNMADLRLVLFLIFRVYAIVRPS